MRMRGELATLVDRSRGTSLTLPPTTRRFDLFLPPRMFGGSLLLGMSAVKRFRSCCRFSRLKLLQTRTLYHTSWRLRPRQVGKASCINLLYMASCGRFVCGVSEIVMHRIQPWPALSSLHHEKVYWPFAASIMYTSSVMQEACICISAASIPLLELVLIDVIGSAKLWRLSRPLTIQPCIVRQQRWMKLLAASRTASRDGWPPYSAVSSRYVMLTA